MRPLLLLLCLAPLAGCSAAPAADAGDDGVIHVVASTNVYGDIAAAIGGDRVEVVSIVDDPAQDPHSVEATARMQLALSKADVVIQNGGGYDAWMGTLLAAVDNPDVVVITVTELSAHEGGDHFNEHLWYDFGTVDRLATALAAQFGTGSEAFRAELAQLVERQKAISDQAGGADVVVTEPIAQYLLSGCGLDDVTPAGFSEAIEEGTDVSPALLAATRDLVAQGTVALLVLNAQTTSAETDAVEQAAAEAGVPVVSVTETVPAGIGYLAWMSSNLDVLETALGGEA